MKLDYSQFSSVLHYVNISPVKDERINADVYLTIKKMQNLLSEWINTTITQKRQLEKNVILSHVVEILAPFALPRQFPKVTNHLDPDTLHSMLKKVEVNFEVPPLIPAEDMCFGRVDDFSAMLYLSIIYKSSSMQNYNSSKRFTPLPEIPSIGSLMPDDHVREVPATQRVDSSVNNPFEHMLTGDLEDNKENKELHTNSEADSPERLSNKLTQKKVPKLNIRMDRLTYHQLFKRKDSLARRHKALKHRNTTPSPVKLTFFGSDQAKGDNGEFNSSPISASPHSYRVPPWYSKREGVKITEWFPVAQCMEDTINEIKLKMEDVTRTMSDNSTVLGISILDSEFEKLSNTMADFREQNWKEFNSMTLELCTVGDVPENTDIQTIKLLFSSLQQNWTMLCYARNEAEQIMRFLKEKHRVYQRLQENQRVIQLVESMMVRRKELLPMFSEIMETWGSAVQAVIEVREDAKSPESLRGVTEVLDSIEKVIPLLESLERYEQHASQIAASASAIREGIRVRFLNELSIQKHECNMKKLKRTTKSEMMTMHALINVQEEDTELVQKLKGCVAAVLRFIYDSLVNLVSEVDEQVQLKKEHVILTKRKYALVEEAESINQWIETKLRFLKKIEPNANNRTLDKTHMLSLIQVAVEGFTPAIRHFETKLAQFLQACPPQDKAKVVQHAHKVDDMWNSLLQRLEATRREMERERTLSPTHIQESQESTQAAQGAVNVVSDKAAIWTPITPVPRVPPRRRHSIGSLPLCVAHSPEISHSASFSTLLYTTSTSHPLDSSLNTELQRIMRQLPHPITLRKVDAYEYVSTSHPTSASHHSSYKGNLYHIGGLDYPHTYFYTFLLNDVVMVRGGGGYEKLHEFLSQKARLKQQPRGTSPSCSEPDVVESRW
jgi:hypothetical protein